MALEARYWIPFITRQPLNLIQFLDYVDTLHTEECQKIFPFLMSMHVISYKLLNLNAHVKEYESMQSSLTLV